MLFFFFFKQKTAYEVRISDWSSDVCSSDLVEALAAEQRVALRRRAVTLDIAMLVTRIDPHAVIGLDAHGRTDDELAKLAEARVIEPVAEPAIVLVVIDGELGGDDVARDRAGDYAPDRFVKAGDRKCVG